MLGKYFVQDIDVDASALLPEHHEGYADFLPLGTKAYYSKHRMESQVWYSIAYVALLFPIWAFIALVSRKEDGAATGTSEVFFTLAVFTLISGAVAILVTLIRSWANYKRGTIEGTWMEGIFIFPTTGDMVIRFQGLWFTEERTFQKENMRDVTLCNRFSRITCGERKYLRLKHRHGVYEFDIDRLQEKPEVVLSYIQRTCLPSRS